MGEEFDIQQALELTRELVSQTGRLAKDTFGLAEAQMKADGSLVTKTDRMIEQIIRERLQRHYPDHAVYGEEDGLTGPQDSPFLWLIDPIDGTNNFVRGVPLWGVSLGLFYEGMPCLGVFGMPCIEQTFWAAEGIGAYCNDHPISVSRGGELARNDLLITSAPNIGCWDYCGPVKYRNVGSAAYGMALVASGSAIGFINGHWHLWDAGATLSLLKEAGALVTDVKGKSLYDITGCDYAAQCPCMIAASPEYHKLLMEHVRLDLQP